MSTHERGCREDSVETELLPDPWRWCPGCRRHVQESSSEELTA